MSSENTAVYVHESRFPLRILKHLVKAGPAGVGSQVQRLDALFRYEAHAQERRPDGSTLQGQSSDETTTSEILTFESPIEGLVTQWCAPEGQLLRDPYQPVLRILEPCKHPVQLGGLCAVCGKDLTSVDYTGFRETSRASISMAHDTANLTVSLEEAARLEKQTTSRLRNEHKLSLIVDLDQTIIHATVDPTVGEWMFDEKNPNFPVLRDVQRFKLLNDDGKEEGCWYYVKPRPTLAHFLEEASKIYELHVYTMGTRQYAENVCRIIDPDGRMFANRILSRDESGSLVRKSLERLFPVDQSMVVIIDDRADIWDWSPHLVKVVPYDFFVGIGDINSAFLPKQTSALATPMPESVEPSPAPEVADNTIKHESLDSILADESAAITEQKETLGHQLLDKPLARMQEEKTAALHEALDHAKSESSSSDTESRDASLHTNGPDDHGSATALPKASSLKANTSASAGPVRVQGGHPNDDLASDSSDSDDDRDSNSDSETESRSAQGLAQSPKTASVGEAEHSRPETKAVHPTGQVNSAAAPPDAVGDSLSIPPEEEAVLHDDDTELERVLDLLGEIHRRFYASADLSDGGVPSIIPRMKSEVLQGCNIVFSGVIPLDKRPETSEVWQLAEQFGATCSQELSRRTTHVVAARKGTSKVNSAQRRRDVSIVTLSWLLTSVNLWRRQPESAYTLDPGSSPQHSDVDSSHPGDRPSPRNGVDEQDASENEDDEADLHEINWGDAEAEIQAFLDETDDEDSRVDSSLEDGLDGSSPQGDTSANPNDRKKRPLSSSTSTNPEAKAAAGSPLAKRRRVAAARAGHSKLKLSENALVPQEGGDGTTDDGEDDELDDFAKALEGELM